MAFSTTNIPVKRMKEIISPPPGAPRIPIRSRIRLAGVELEGGWITLPKDIPRLTHDGTVFREIPAPAPFNYKGEIPSRPLPVDKLPEWMRTHYPSTVNATCGMHIHMSFHSPAIYERLISEAYPAAMILFLTQWAEEKKFPKKSDHQFQANGNVLSTFRHPIWDRLAGKNRFCAHEFIPGQQIKSEDKSKHYSAVNYCYGLHSTVEIRVLPMFDLVEDAIEAYRRVILITNAFLVATAKRSEKFTYTMDTPELNAIREEFRGFI